MWQAFVASDPSHSEYQLCSSFYFCDNEPDADVCADLVMKSIKQATAGSLWWYEKTNEKLPVVDDFYIVTDWKGKAKAVIKTIKVERVPYNQVTEEFAYIEGEGDRSLAFWKKVHWAFYTREMAPYDEAPTEDMIIICEYFKTIWT